MRRQEELRGMKNCERRYFSHLENEWHATSESRRTCRKRRLSEQAFPGPISRTPAGTMHDASHGILIQFQLRTRQLPVAKLYYIQYGAWNMRVF